MGQYYLVTIVGSKLCVIPGFPMGMKLTEHCYIDNGFVRRIETLLQPNGLWYKQRLVWSGDYADPEPGTDKNFWDMDLDDIHDEIKNVAKKSLPYVINHDKKQYVDVDKLRNGKFLQYHPLPILCVEGNGLGGGDYNGPDPNNLVGSWARNSISCEYEKPDGYTELEFVL